MKPCRFLVTLERVNELLRYDSEAGVFKWLVDRKGNAKAGTVAGSVWKSTGYIQISIDNVSYAAHRLAWFVTYGEWPPTILDHRDKDKTNNRIRNLRLANFSGNRANSKLNATSTSGFKGVSWKRGAWEASIRINERLIYLGRFAAVEDAALAYNFAAREAFNDFASLNIASERR